MSDVSDVSSSSSGVKESPPDQVMMRSDVPDPYRIPSTVFESRSPTPMNWSVASNESLFSIHVGSSSFSRDHVLLGRSGDLSNYPGSPFDPYPLTPHAEEPDTKTDDVTSAFLNGSVDKGKSSGASIRHSTSTSRQSDSSTHSFAFPILAERSGSMKNEPHNQSQYQMKPADQSETPDKASDAQNTKWFPFCPCSFCP